MPFKVVVADPSTGKSYKLEARDPDARRLIGLRIRDKFDGALVGLPGYEIELTGGTDRDGFPMRSDIAGSGRTSVLLAGGAGFSPKKRGERRRKRVRGSRISEAISQVNAKIVKHGEKPIESILVPKEPEGKAPEKPKEEPKPKPEIQPQKPPEKPAKPPEEKEVPEKPAKPPEEKEVKSK